MSTSRIIPFSRRAFLRRSLAAAAVVSLPNALYGAKLGWATTEHSLALIREDQTLWQLHYDPREGKPYFHPLSAPAGPVLTALRPADHVWHRALWWSWKFINGLNYWEEDRQSGRSAGVTELVRAQSETQPAGSGRVEMELSYHPVNAAPVLREQRTLRLGAPEANGSYRIDWSSTFTAVQDAKLDRTPYTAKPGQVGSGGYAGLSVRLAAAFRHWKFTTSEAGASETLLTGFTARWIDFAGPLPQGEPAGLAVFDHPSNLRHPTPWYGKQGMPYFSPAVLFHEPYTLAAGKSLTMKYRVLVHAGGWGRQAIEREWQAFSSLRS